jgi:AraC-like DNA-binding protein
MGEMLQPNRFSFGYRGAARGRDYEEWREHICRTFCRLDVGPAENDYVDCHGEIALVDSLSLGIPTGSSARYARTRDLHHDGCDDFVLVSASRGKVEVKQENNVIELSAGQMCLAEMNVVGWVGLTSAGGYTAARIPRRFLLDVSPRAETRLATALGHGPALRSMIDRYFALCLDVAQDLDAVGQKTAAQHFVDLIGLLLGTRPEQEAIIDQRGYAPRLDLMKAAILGRLDRHDLSIDAVAQANGLSGRQAQRLFAQSGMTFSEFVLEQRLLRARRLLRDAANRHRKISDIAYAAGFGDLSYFNRTFRKRFCVTPSDMQAEQGESRSWRPEH